MKSLCGDNSSFAQLEVMASSSLSQGTNPGSGEDMRTLSKGYLLIHLMRSEVSTDKTKAKEIINEIYPELHNKYQTNAKELNCHEELILGMIFCRGGEAHRNVPKGLALLAESSAAGNSAAQGLLCGYYLFGSKSIQNIDEGIKLATAAVEMGNPMAQHYLGKLYLMKPYEDVPKAIQLLTLSASQGYREAQYSLAECYDIGYGVPQNTSEAVRLYTLAADKGHGKALFALGRRYLNGDGVPMNESKALEYFQSSADKGVRQAQGTLAYCYLRGFGVPKNGNEAYRYFKLSLAHNSPVDPMALYGMGICYEKGLGTKQDVDLAFSFYNQAAMLGHKEAQQKIATAFNLPPHVGLGPVEE